MWIECGIINYKLIIPFIYPLFYQIRRLIHNGESKPFFEFFTNYCGYLLSGLIYLFIKWRMKGKKEKNEPLIQNVDNIIFELGDYPAKNENNEERNNSMHLMKSIVITKTTKSNNSFNQIFQHKKKIEKKQSQRKHIYIFILVCIYLIPMFLDAYSIYNSYSFKTSSAVSLFFTIISYVILCRLILGLKVYMHQILSLTIILISNIVIIILILIDEDNSNFIISLVLIIAVVTLYSLFNNLIKRYFNIYMGSPYYLMFIIGLLSIILILLYEIITVIAFGLDQPFNGIFYQMKYNYEKNNLYPLIFIADIITAFLWVGGIILTIYFFTPCHFIISESISQILSTLIDNSLEESPLYKKIIIYILFIIIIIGSLIYNEVFILNIWSLKDNTQKHIIQRQKAESIKINNEMRAIYEFDNDDDFRE